MEDTSFTSVIEIFYSPRTKILFLETFVILTDVKKEEEEKKIFDSNLCFFFFSLRKKLNIIG